MKTLLTILVFLTFANLTANAEIINKTLTLPADGLKELAIDCGAGFLKVEGAENLSEIRVEAEIILEGLSEDETADFMERHVELSLKERGSKAVLRSHIENPGGFFRSLMSGTRSQLINLTVQVPMHMTLDIEDGSGFMEIRNIGSGLDVIDGSGEMTIRNISGDVDINDGSGSASVEDVEGDLDFDDGSGELEIKNISGSVEINDGSGSLSVRGVKGDVFIDDGSGELRVENIAGNVRINDGSGSIYVEEVDRDVTILEAGSGSVQIANVRGKVYREED
jgi:hypothetical protein